MILEPTYSAYKLIFACGISAVLHSSSLSQTWYLCGVRGVRSMCGSWCSEHEACSMENEASMGGLLCRYDAVITRWYDVIASCEEYDPANLHTSPYAFSSIGHRATEPLCHIVQSTNPPRSVHLPGLESEVPRFRSHRIWFSYELISAA